MLSALNKYKPTTKKENTTNSIIDFDVKPKSNGLNVTSDMLLSALAVSKENYVKESEPARTDDYTTRIENDDGSYCEITNYKNGTEKKITHYSDGSYDEIYKNKDGVSYMRIKRFEGGDNYTEIYQDSAGFCGKETFTKLDDGSTVSVNEYNNGKKYTETYRKNPDGGFTRKIENNDGTGYTETQAYKGDGTSSYSIENEDGSGNTIVYNPDGSYVEILTDSNGKVSINKYGT